VAQHPDRRHGAVVRLRPVLRWLDVFLMSFFFLLSGLSSGRLDAKARGPSRDDCCDGLPFLLDCAL